MVGEASPERFVHSVFEHRVMQDGSGVDERSLRLRHGDLVDRETEVQDVKRASRRSGCVVMASIQPAAYDSHGCVRASGGPGVVPAPGRNRSGSR